MPRPVHFDMSAEDPARAVQFYDDVFGWKFQKWDGPMDYWMITTGTDDMGINGGLSKRTSYNSATVNSIGVPSVDEYLNRITSAGGKVVMPKTAIPGVCWLATCLDPEGNQFGLVQADAEAK